MTPRDAIARAHGFVRAYDLRFVDCFAEDGVLELPFAPPGVPRRLVGRVAIKRMLEPAYRAAREAGRQITGYRDERIHVDAEDPEVVTHEFTLDGRDAAGASYAHAFVQVTRVRDGQIVEMRDYFDSFALAARLRPPRKDTGATPREVVLKLLSSVCEGKWEELAALYAEDAVVTHAHDVPLPTRHEGRAQLAEHFAHGKSLPLTLQARNIVVHETIDPEVVVAEFDYLGRVTTTNRSFQISNIFVMRIRDGEIVQSRDYANRFALAHALGALPELLARLPKADGG
jgi:ketosteroid isomerase-like protein